MGDTKDSPGKSPGGVVSRKKSNGGGGGGPSASAASAHGGGAPLQLQQQQQQHHHLHQIPASLLPPSFLPPPYPHHMQQQQQHLPHDVVNMASGGEQLLPQQQHLGGDLSYQHPHYRSHHAHARAPSPPPLPPGEDARPMHLLFDFGLFETNDAPSPPRAASGDGGAGGGPNANKPLHTVMSNATSSGGTMVRHSASAR